MSRGSKSLVWKTQIVELNKIVKELSIFHFTYFKNRVYKYIFSPPQSAADRTVPCCLRWDWRSFSESYLSSPDRSISSWAPQRVLLQILVDWLMRPVSWCVCLRRGFQVLLLQSPVSMCPLRRCLHHGCWLWGAGRNWRIRIRLTSGSEYVSYKHVWDHLNVSRYCIRPSYSYHPSDQSIIQRII